MLDVHPPHPAAHTWKDFFIHIATIVVGLLIAVGLEQTVEAIHHRVQRQELIKDLAQEADENLRSVDVDLDALGTAIRWSDQAYRQILLSATGAALPLQPFPDLPMRPMQGLEWQSALSSGEVNVLPSAFRDRYAQVYHFYANAALYENDDSKALYALDTVLGPVPRTKEGGFDLTDLNDEQRRRIMETIGAFRSTTFGLMRQSMFLSAFSSAQLHALGKDELSWQQEVGQKHDALVLQHPELNIHLGDRPGKP